VVDHGHHASAVFRRLLVTNDHVIAVLDMAVDHGVALDLQDEAFGPAEKILEFKELGVIDGLQRRAGSDPAQVRKAS